MSKVIDITSRLTRPPAGVARLVTPATTITGTDLSGYLALRDQCRLAAYFEEIKSSIRLDLTMLKASSGRDAALRALGELADEIRNEGKSS